MTMIEKVAIALHERDQAKEQPMYRIPWSACVARYQDELRGDARAAIEAMRDWPSVELHIDGIAGAPIGSGYGRRFWHDAIDSALLPDSDLHKVDEPE